MFLGFAKFLGKDLEIQGRIGAPPAHLSALAGGAWGAQLQEMIEN